MSSEGRQAAVVAALDRIAEGDGVVAGSVNGLTFHLPAEVRERLRSDLAEWISAGGLERLWRGDVELWTGGDESRWLGWLTLVTDGLSSAERMEELSSWSESLSEELFGDGDGAVALLGMGGSTLGPEVLAETLARQVPLHVLDTTDPGQVERIAGELDLERTAFIVSSKSGTTLETALLCDLFYERVKEQLGPEAAGARFTAVTDPGSELEGKARELGFRRVFHGEPSVGGRYSVLSAFGLAPAAAVGIDVRRLLGSAVPMVRACLEDGDGLLDNPAVALGLLLGRLARQGRDKLTLVATPGLESFGAWAEQLIAESTGKDGRGIVPVDLENPSEPGAYGDDRVFVGLFHEKDREGAAEELGKRLDALEAVGHPVVRLVVRDEYAVSQEFFRWQFATAVAGSVLEVDPFDQPDVEASKDKSRQVARQLEAGSFEEPEPSATTGAIQVFAPQTQREELLRPGDGGVVELLLAHFQRIRSGDYFAITAYMDRSSETLDLLQSMRHKVREQLGVATCVGYGPRFLHSTGQLHKGGPDGGVFLQLTHEDLVDVDLPSRALTLGQFKKAQARGDFEVLAERGRRLLRVHLTGKLVAGLQRLDGFVGRALQQVSTED